MNEDLAALLAQAIIANRDEINASRIAQGESGRIEISVNLALRRIDVHVMVRDKAA